MGQLVIQKKDLSVGKIDLDAPFAVAQRGFIEEVERQYNLGLPVRVIILKARQMGMSTATEGTLFNWCFLHPGCRALVIAHETKASQNLFEMTKLMWEEWIFRSGFHERHNTQKTLSWEETRSSMSVATARNAGSGRSFTYHAVHASECAFWEEPERLLTGLNQSVPYKHGTIIVLESTANGVGNWFHTEWQRAVHKESNYVPLFFPWYVLDEYSIPATTLRTRDLDEEEKDIAEQFNLTLPQLAWRRQTIQNECLGDLNKFHQEYPSTPDEAFLTTGHHVFPLVKLEECYEPKQGQRGFLHDNNGRITFTPDPTGPITIYAWPSSDRDWGRYVVAGDPSRTTYGDGAAIQVFNRRTYEQVAVGHWPSGQSIDPIPFAHQLIMLGYYYNEALLNVEINGPGYGCIAIIMQMDYPNVWRHRWADKSPGKLSQSWGWSMSYSRKNWAIGEVINLIAQHMLTIHDEWTYDEMRNYVHLAGYEIGPASNQGNDDLVTSLLIAICSDRTEPALTYPGENVTSFNDFDGGPPWQAFGR
jgi:hypothetical protein